MNEAMVIHPSAYAFVALAIIGGLIAVSLRNMLHAIFGLALALVGVAGLFLYLNSPFVAAMELLIYVGGISVAMVFAVMLSYLITAREDGGLRQGLAALPAVAFFGVVAFVLHHATFNRAGQPSQEAWSVAVIGRALLTRYSLIFEALSVILLMAIVGAIIIARKEAKR